MIFKKHRQFFFKNIILRKKASLKDRIISISLSLSLSLSLYLSHAHTNLNLSVSTDFNERKQNEKAQKPLREDEREFERRERDEGVLAGG